MKMLDHPNIVNLIEVINDPETDRAFTWVSMTTFFSNARISPTC